jgi:hypothetical protein
MHVTGIREITEVIRTSPPYPGFIFQQFWPAQAAQPLPSRVKNGVGSLYRMSKVAKMPEMDVP